MSELSPTLAIDPDGGDAPALGGRHHIREIFPRTTRLAPGAKKRQYLTLVFPHDVARKDLPETVDHESAPWEKTSTCLHTDEPRVLDDRYQGPGWYVEYRKSGSQHHICPECEEVEWKYLGKGAWICLACDHQLAEHSQQKRCHGRGCGQIYTEFEWFDPSGCPSCSRSFVD